MGKGKYLLWGAGLVGLVLGGRYLYKLRRLSGELEVVTSVTLQGLNLRVDVTLKNPTEGSITVKHPFVKMMYKGDTFASSDVKDVDYVLPKFGQKKLDPIIIKLSFLTLATSFPAMARQYRTQGTMTIDVNIITTINNKIPFTKNEKMTIGNGTKSLKA